MREVYVFFSWSPTDTLLVMLLVEVTLVLSLILCSNLSLQMGALASASLFLGNLTAAWFRTLLFSLFSLPSLASRWLGASLGR